MMIQIVFIISFLTLVKSQTTILNPAQVSNLYSTSYSYIISSMLVTVPNNQTSSSSVRNGTAGPIISRPSKSGLSTGAICAIAIPTIAALLGVAAVAAFFSGAATVPAAAPAFTAPSLPEPTFIDTSLTKFNIPNQMPIQQPQPIQIIEHPQPQPIQVEPVKEVPRVDYQVNRVIEPPRVNIAPQQVQMVPIQEVQMVPVQEVQMIPVEQVELVPVQQIGAIPEVNAVPLQQIVPMNQAFPIGQVAEAVPQVVDASISPASVEFVSQGQLGSQLISSTSQLMPQSQVLPSQVLPTFDQGIQSLPSQYL